MFPLGFVFGAVAGAAAAVLFFGEQVAHRARPVAKAAVKTALMAMHEFQVHGAEIAEAAEDLYAEAKAEVTTEAFAAMAAAQAKAEARPASKTKSPRASGEMRPAQAAANAARKRTAVKRSRRVVTKRG